jgi:hypothetical protein
MGDPSFVTGAMLIIDGGDLNGVGYFRRLPNPILPGTTTGLR